MKKLFLKKIFVLISFLLLSFVSSNLVKAQERVVIGEIQNGNPTITMDINLIKHNLEFFLNANGIDVILTDFSIKYSGDTYVLCALTENKKFSCVITLELNEGTFYESSAPCQGTLVVSCQTGCDTECQALILDCKGYCTPPCPKGECKRTVTLTQDPVLPDRKK